MPSLLGIGGHAYVYLIYYGASIAFSELLEVGDYLSLDRVWAPFRGVSMPKLTRVPSYVYLNDVLTSSSPGYGKVDLSGLRRVGTSFLYQQSSSGAKVTHLNITSLATVGDYCA